MKNWSLQDLVELDKRRGSNILSSQVFKKQVVIDEEVGSKPKRGLYSRIMLGDNVNEVKLFIKPLSTNRAWKGRRIKSDAYKAYETEVLWSLPELTLPEPPYCVTYVFGVSSRGFDCGNAEKQTTDVISKYYRFNDNLIYRFIIDKVIVKKGAEYFQFKIETLKK